MQSEKKLQMAAAYAEVSAVKEVDRSAEVSVTGGLLSIGRCKCDSGRVFVQDEIAKKQRGGRRLDLVAARCTFSPLMDIVIPLGHFCA